MASCHEVSRPLDYSIRSEFDELGVESVIVTEVLLAGNGGTQIKLHTHLMDVYVQSVVVDSPES